MPQVQCAPPTESDKSGSPRLFPSEGWCSATEESARVQEEGGSGGCAVTYGTVGELVGAVVESSSRVVGPADTHRVPGSTPGVRCSGSFATAPAAAAETAGAVACASDTHAVASTVNKTEHTLERPAADAAAGASVEASRAPAPASPSAGESQPARGNGQSEHAGAGVAAADNVAGAQQASSAAAAAEPPPHLVAAPGPSALPGPRRRPCLARVLTGDSEAVTAPAEATLAAEDGGGGSTSSAGEAGSRASGAGDAPRAPGAAGPASSPAVGSAQGAAAAPGAGSVEAPAAMVRAGSAETVGGVEGRAAEEPDQPSSQWSRPSSEEDLGRHAVAEARASLRRQWTMTAGLWSDRHVPRSLEELPARPWRALTEWVRCWGLGRGRSGRVERRAALVVGPSGVGKSLGARLAALHARRRMLRGPQEGGVLELDAAEDDGRRFVQNILKRQCTVAGGAAPAAVIIDIDSAPPSVRQSLLRAVGLAPMPILLVASHDHGGASKLDESLTRTCFVVEVHARPTEEVVRRLRNAVEGEGLVVSEAAQQSCLEPIAHACNGDFRRALNHVQLLSRAGLELSGAAELAAPEASCRWLLSHGASGAPPVADRMELAAVEPERVAALVQANYLSAAAAAPTENSEGTATGADLEHLALAAASIAQGDIAFSTGFCTAALAAPTAVAVAVLFGSVLPGLATAAAGGQMPRLLTEPPAPAPAMPAKAGPVPTGRSWERRWAESGLLAAGPLGSRA